MAPLPSRDDAKGPFPNLKLQGESREAFEELCRLGCDRKALGSRFVWLFAVARVQDPSAKFVFGSMDSRQAALGTFDPRRLASLHRRLVRLAAGLRRGRRLTRLALSIRLALIELGDATQNQGGHARLAMAEDKAPIAFVMERDGLTRLSKRAPRLEQWASNPEECATYLEHWACYVQRFEAFADGTGARKKPDFNRILREMSNYVTSKTGRPRDELVSAVLGYPRGGDYGTEAHKAKRYRLRRAGR